MNEWIAQIKKEREEQVSPQEEVFSIAPSTPVSSTQQPQAQEGAITQLGSSYEIKHTTTGAKSAAATNQEKKEFPYALLLAAILIPAILLVLVGGMVKGRPTNTKDKAFLYNTIESKYFTLNHGPEYTVESAVDKKVPFLEKHTLTSSTDNQKTLNIIIKDVSFDYDLNNNSNVRARRDKPDIYLEEPVKIQNRDGVYFKKNSENFEHMIVAIDRSNSVLYEIQFYSPTSLATDETLASEMAQFISTMTLL